MTFPLRGRACISIAVAALVCGCATPQRELEKVAKDWCLTIRASQVVPVYPLTEDLLPGDVFLVEQPIHEQARVYKERGFLPLDLLAARLGDLHYDEFYQGEYWDNLFSVIPHQRAIRTVPTDGTPTPPFTMVEAPRAAFPSYTFEVRRGAGLKIAIPVQGVPIGFGFLRSDSAQGSITISDAYTYAADPTYLYSQLIAWASDNRRREVLSQLQAQNPDHPLYLRVVQRVYLTGGVLVTLVADSAQSTGLDVGAAQNAEVIELSQQETQANFKAASDAMTAALGSGLKLANGLPAPGGSLRIVQATSRSVSLKENFDRPLVIGYLGYDFPILTGGELGVPIATITQLEQAPFGLKRPPIAKYNDDPAAESVRSDILTWLAQNQGDPAPTERMAQYLKARFSNTDPPAVWTLSARTSDLEEVARELKVPRGAAAPGQ